MSRPAEPVAQECVEAYAYVAEPLELLVLRRPPSHRWAGRWMPVSGKVDPTDADFEAAVRRELREETGPFEPQELWSLDWQLRFRSESGATWRLHAYAVRFDRRFEPTLSDEHDAWAWVSPDEAARRLHFPDNRKAVARLVERLPRRSRNV